MRNSRLGCILLVTIIFAAFSFQLSALSHAELIDGVAAFVDDVAITVGELDETYQKTKKLKPDINRYEVLNTMINRMLLMNEARKLKIEAKTDEELLNEYIELKVKAFIKLREEDLEDFYRNNISEFKDVTYESVRNKIEKYLTEKEINTVLKKHIDELRSKAYVKIVVPGL